MIDDPTQEEPEDDVPEDPNTPRPMGQLRIDADKRRWTDLAEENGWEMLSYDPMIFERDGKQIFIEYNSAGVPHKAQWLRGEDFPNMGSLGVLDLSTLATWFAWRPEEEEDGAPVADRAGSPDGGSDAGSDRQHDGDAEAETPSSPRDTDLSGEAELGAGGPDPGAGQGD